jgi:hypothetical protein
LNEATPIDEPVDNEMRLEDLLNSEVPVAEPSIDATSIVAAGEADDRPAAVAGGSEEDVNEPLTGMETHPIAAEDEEMQGRATAQIAQFVEEEEEEEEEDANEPFARVEADAIAAEDEEVKGRATQWIAPLVEAEEEEEEANEPPAVWKSMPLRRMREVRSQ